MEVGEGVVKGYFGLMLQGIVDADDLDLFLLRE